MTTRKLLWGMTRRGAVWGLLTGTLGGAAYGVVFTNGLYIFVMIFQPELLQSKNEPTGITAFVLLVLFGAIMGVLFGLPIGLLVGILDGLLIGIVTRVLFYPLRHVRAYRWTVVLVSAVFTGIATWFGFMQIELFLEMMARSESDFNRLVIFFLVPALIASVAAAFISRSIARWYETETQKQTL